MHFLGQPKTKIHITHALNRSYMALAEFPLSFIHKIPLTLPRLESESKGTIAGTMAWLQMYTLKCEYENVLKLNKRAAIVDGVKQWQKHARQCISVLQKNLLCVPKEFEATCAIERELFSLFIEGFNVRVISKGNQTEPARFQWERHAASLELFQIMIYIMIGWVC